MTPWKAGVYITALLMAAEIMPQSPASGARPLIEVPPLLGRWECTNSQTPLNAVIDFRANGTFITTTPLGNFQGQWHRSAADRVTHLLRNGRPVTVQIVEYSQQLFRSYSIATPSVIDTCRRASQEVCIEGDCLNGSGALFDMAKNHLVRGTFNSGALMGPVTMSARYGTAGLFIIEASIDAQGKIGGPGRLTWKNEEPFHNQVVTGHFSNGRINGECRSEWIGRSKQSSMVFEGVCKAGERTLGRYLLKDASGASYRITVTDFEARPWKVILSADGRADIRGTLTDTQFFKSASGESSLACSISNTEYTIECQSPQASSE